MRNFSVNLIEQNTFHFFSVNSANKTEYIFRDQKGILRRKYNGEWNSSAVELSSLNDAKKFLTKDVKLSLGLKPFPDIQFDPGMVLRENNFLLNSLGSLRGVEWLAVFRARLINRIIISNKNIQYKNHFNHFSVLVRLKLGNSRKYLEVGEGNTEGFRFNQNGLGLRIKKIIANHQNRRDFNFSGTVPIVLNSGDGGILFHEILGHSLEADYIYQNLSSISLGDINKKIVSKNVEVTVYDKNDPFFAQHECDDEGEISGSAVLIKKGILRNIISDFFYRELLKIPSGGHSRLEDFSKIPMPRMYALYLRPGDYQPEELIESTKYGIYASEFGDGKILFNKNRFFFNIKEAYLIENGKVTYPLGDIIVSGNITEVLNSVAMIGNDFRYDKGISYCIKNGQTLNVRVGQPTIKINNLQVSKGFDD